MRFWIVCYGLLATVRSGLVILNWIGVGSFYAPPNPLVEILVKPVMSFIADWIVLGLLFRWKHGENKYW